MRIQNKNDKFEIFFEPFKNFRGPSKIKETVRITIVLMHAPYFPT